MVYQNILTLVLHIQTYSEHDSHLTNYMIQDDTMIDNRDQTGFTHRNGSITREYDGFIVDALDIKSNAIYGDNVNSNPAKKRKLI